MEASEINLEDQDTREEFFRRHVWNSGVATWDCVFVGIDPVKEPTYACLACQTPKTRVKDYKDVIAHAKTRAHIENSIMWRLAT
jgi:hypothetical protein